MKLTRIPFRKEDDLSELLHGTIYRMTNLIQIYLRDFTLPGEHPAAAYFFNVFPGGTWEAKANEFADPKRIPDMERMMEKTLAALT